MNLYDDLHVEFHDDFANLSIELYIFQRQNGRLIVAKPAQLVMKEVPEGLAVEPFLRIPWDTQLLKGFAEALAKRGVKTEPQAKLEGTLDATKYHLEDLRTLIKLRKP